MIEVRGLTKRYGSTVAVDRLSFDVPPGGVTGFLGLNGSGKSTTMRMILGLDAGHARYQPVVPLQVTGRRVAAIPSRRYRAGPPPEWRSSARGAGRAFVMSCARRARGRRPGHWS